MNIEKSAVSALTGSANSVAALTGLSAERTGEQSFAELLKQSEAKKSLEKQTDPKLANAKLDTEKEAAASARGKLNHAQDISGNEARPGETPTARLNRLTKTDPVQTRHQQVEKAAEGLISNALILPMLKQLRRSVLSENTIFSGGNGEKSFGPEFDMELSDRIAKSPRLGVKNALVAKLEARNNPLAKTSTTKPTPSSRIDLNA